MPEIQYIVTKGIIQFAGFCELRKMHGEEPETKHIYRIDPFRTSGSGIQLAGIAFNLFFPAVYISGDTETEFQVVLPRIFLFVMVDHHAHIIQAPLGMPVISFDGILH